MATNLVAKIGQNYLPPALIALPFRSGMGCHNRNMRVNSVNDASIFCENFMKFGPVTPELTLVICERQLRHVQTSGSAMAEGPRDALISRNFATTKHPI